MIVSSMNYSELRKEVENDLVFVNKKSKYVEAELEKKMRRNKLKTITHVYDYRSPNNNKWFVKMEIGLKNVGRSFMTYFYVDNKIAAIHIVDTPFLLYYTSHFFKRYKERLKLDIIKPEDIVRKYLTDSTNLIPKVLEVVDSNLWKMHIISNHGTILGNLHIDTGICKMNTFLSSDMLKSDQIEREKEMKEHLTKYNKDTRRLD